jgi:glycosyltransferase involved in cell wall biosynthesis
MGVCQPNPLRASVIVPTYNRLAGVRRVLAQLDRQTLAPVRYDAVVIDDGSSLDIRSELSPADYGFPLQIVRQPNAGPAAARQLGARSTTGDVLVFVDDDVELPPQFLAVHLAAHGADERLVVIGRLGAESAARGVPLAERYRLGIGDRFSAAVQAGRREPRGLEVYTGNLSLRRVLFDEVGGLDCSLRQL